MIDRAGDVVRVQTFVRVPLRDAFDVFTLEIDRWWGHGPAYRVGGKHQGPLHLEPTLGGRVFQQYGKAGDAVHEIGTITTWDPPNAFAFTWRGINFKPSDSNTHVSVRFEPGTEGTRVFLEHRGWADIPADAPVRHGEPVDKFIATVGMWWGRLVSFMREYSEEKLP
ncbi:SRPBCC domain-containing protein [soil metagenome]